MTLTPHPTLLQLCGISKHFGAVQALVDVNFEVRAGEVVGLVGDNGAGKSTLVKGISGIFPFDKGEYIFEGKRQIIHSPQDVAQLGIETVYQDLALCDNLDVVANLYLGRENTVKVHASPLAAIDEIAMEKRTLDVLHGLAVDLPNVRMKTAALSGGQRQAVAVARAVMWNSKLVLLDEPTAALGIVQTRQVLDLIRRLRKQGLGVVVVSHQLAAIFEVCDRIVVLRLGRNAGNFDAHTTSFDQIITAITGKQASAEDASTETTGARITL
jgi:D-xylose transport system ATP-binding protein